MFKYIVWFKVDGDMNPTQKSSISSKIHQYLFENEDGIKIKTKSNFFLFKSEDTADEIVDFIVNIASENIKCFVSQIQGNYQGWLDEEQWEFLN